MMPSARMSAEGEIAFGYCQTPPYRVYSGKVQVLDHFEATVNYRIFSDIPDPVFGHLGFGDFADKGANIKWALILPEDSDYLLPGVAVGWDDFLGTKAFESQYVVATQILPKLGLEASFGWGFGHIQGPFGGLIWWPYPFCKLPFTRNLFLTAEWDGTDFPNDPHPEGRTHKTSINYGIKCRLFDWIDVTVSSLRGEEVAFGISGHYNFGSTKGFLPKFQDPLPYRAPRITEPIGVLRPEEAVLQDLFFALREQGFRLLDVYLTADSCMRTLTMKVQNCTWYFERELRKRLNGVLSNLIPSNVDEVVVILEAGGMPIQSYRYNRLFLDLHASCEMGHAEMELLIPREEVIPFDHLNAAHLFHDDLAVARFALLPKFYPIFGSSDGKFKYALGLSLGSQGFLPGEIFYDWQVGWIFTTDFENFVGRDILNPSQLINVNTDIVCYYRQKGITFDRMYFQKNLNFTHGWFTRVAGGYFSQNYGGVGSEILYYPANSPWAIGCEGALLWKRTFTGLGFTDKIRKFVGTEPVFVPFTGHQYFLDLYYDKKDWDLLFKLSGGKFLAEDIGFRTQIEKYFHNGLRLFAWITLTNGNDRINGQIYYDKGIGISMPLDFFLPASCRRRLTFATSAWLRDVGYRGPCGQPLFEMIQSQRIE